MLDYTKQLEFKENMIRNNLKRIGGFEEIPFEAMLGMEEPFRYRNKAQFPVGTDKEVIWLPVSMQEEPMQSFQTGSVIWVWRSINRFWYRAGIYGRKNQITAYDEQTGKGLYVMSLSDMVLRQRRLWYVWW